MIYNSAAQILYSVILAMKVGRKRNSETSYVVAAASEGLQPEKDMATRFYHYCPSPVKYQTAFPVLQFHSKEYTVVVSYVENLITFWAVEDSWVQS